VRRLVVNRFQFGCAAKRTDARLACFERAVEVRNALPEASA
jgi:hypothetical protein